jgi:hypothetical protein
MPSRDSGGSRYALCPLGDVVLVGFDSNSDARILGYDAIS